MAKKAKSAGSGATMPKRGSAKKGKASAGKVKRAKTERRASSSGRRSGESAADAMLKLLQSPLVADLLAVGATAALASISETRHSRLTGADAKSSKTAKAAAKAAAAAIGRRLSTEFEEIKKAANKPRARAGG